MLQYELINWAIWVHRKCITQVFTACLIYLEFFSTLWTTSGAELWHIRTDVSRRPQPVFNIAENKPKCTSASRCSRQLVYALFGCTCRFLPIVRKLFWEFLIIHFKITRISYDFTKIFPSCLFIEKLVWLENAHSSWKSEIQN